MGREDERARPEVALDAELALDALALSECIREDLERDLCEVRVPRDCGTCPEAALASDHPVEDRGVARFVTVAQCEFGAESEIQRAC